MAWDTYLWARFGDGVSNCLRKSGTLQPSSDLRKFGQEIEECVDAAFGLDGVLAEDNSELKAKRLKWASLLKDFQQYGNYSNGNQVTVLEGGDTCFDKMLERIASAGTRVWCESYIFDSSYVGELFFTALRDAAERGCDVMLLVDYVGAFSLRNDWIEELRRNGAEVVFFNPVLPASACVGPYTFRDHRKITICDQVGFVGGMNIQEEVGEEKYGTSHFYDVHAMLEGPCVADLAEVFRDSLHESGSGLSRDPIPRPAKLEPGMYVQILQSNVRQRRRTLQQVITRALDAADDSVCLTTAYFFPPGFLRRALLGVPRRGASLSLLLSGSSDFYPLPGDLLAQTHFLGKFLRDAQGAKGPVGVNLYGKRHMHAKHMTVDGVFSTIGSFNFDLYSARRNLEVGVSIFDRSCAQRLRDLHEARSSESRATTLSDPMYHQYVVRLVCAAAYAGIRLSGRNFFDGLDCFQRKWEMRKAALTFQLEEQAAQFVATSMMWGLD